MRIFKAVFFVPILWLALNACKPSSHTLPAVTSLDDLKQTAFVATLNNQLPPGKNIIYAPTILYAWNEVKAEVDSNLATPSHASADFALLNSSKGFVNSLNKGDYQTETEVNGGYVTARASFHIDLPFAHHFDAVPGGISFDHKKVLAFGMNAVNYKITNSARILFYKDDDNFALQLTPKDTLHAIILIKGLKTNATFNDVLKQTTAWINAGEVDQNNKAAAWRYNFNDADSIAIPVISLNLETNYKTLEGQTFLSKGKQYTLQTAWQRTAFLLDENGAIVESEAIAAADSVAIPEKMHPKNMVFDKPFFIIIKRLDKQNPYFMMKVENTELLTRIEK
jgi:hypothetical protein